MLKGIVRSILNVRAAFATVALFFFQASADAQADFRRGDVNEDGSVDIGDVAYLIRWMLTGEVAVPSCMDAVDTEDDGNIGGIPDLGYLFNFLQGGPSPPPPGPESPGPDPSPDDLGCEAYGPRPPSRLANLDLAFESIGELSGQPGETVRFEAAVLLTISGNTAGTGPEGWSISLFAEGARVLEATTSGTAASDDRLFLPPRSKVVSDPSTQEEGAVSMVFLVRRFPYDWVTRPAEGTMTILRLTLEAMVPATDPAMARLRFIDGRKGLFGGPVVRNIVAIEGTAQIPEFHDLEIRLVPLPNSQLPGDCNQDGALDISDAICLLGHLFLGSPATMPCEGGTVLDPGNVALLDSNSDGMVDLSDAVRVLWYLFGGSPPPVLGAECIPIAGCPDNSAECSP